MDIAPLIPERLVDLLVQLPADRPFTSGEVLSMATHREVRALVRSGLVAHPMRGVYRVAALDEDLRVRVEMLKLVVPEECVVTDRTAGWLWGAEMVLAPNDHLATPRVHVFSPPGYRLRNGLTASGERMLADRDVVVLDGLRVTTPLRTACDLGRLLHRDQAFAALDALARLEAFSLDELALEATRFRGYRGVIQLRAFIPLVDPRSQSPGESILRLRWLDCGLPKPQCQVEVETSWGTSYWVDIGLPERRFGTEYDGDEFHDEAAEAHDERRRGWLREQAGWTIVVARRANVHGRAQDIHASLQAGYATTVRAGRPVRN